MDFRVLFTISFQEKPFVFVRESKNRERVYAGLCIDLLEKLKEKMKFRYAIEESEGNIYGAPDIFTGEIGRASCRERV